MMSLFLAIHIHAAKRGDGLLPEFLGMTPRPRDVPKAVNANPAQSTGELQGASKPDPRSRKTVRRPVVLWSGSPFHGNGEPLYPFVLTKFRTENRSHFSWNCSGRVYDPVGLTRSCTNTANLRQNRDKTLR